MHELYREDIEYIADLPLPWEKLEGKDILIVGASGLIGTCLVDALVRRNEKYNSGIGIFTLGRSLEKARSRFGDYLKEGKITFIQQDISKPLTTERHFDFYIHGASNTHPVAYASDPVGTITANVFGMYHILEHGAAHGAERILLISTVEIYGNSPSPEGFREKDMGYIDCNTQRAGYPESKRVAESLCQAYLAGHDTDVVIGRLCRTYGPTMSMDDSKALAQFIRNGVRGEDVVLKSEGNQNFSYCYMADAVAGLLTILLKGEKGEAYNIADPGSDVRLKDIAGVIAAQAGRKVVFQLPEKTEQQGFSVVMNGLLNAEKLRELGFQARYDINAGIERTVRVLKDSEQSMDETATRDGKRFDKNDDIM